MTASLLHHLDKIARNLTPLALSLLFVFFSALPFYLPDLGRISPHLAVLATVYWAIYRPDLFPAAAAFAVGLWQDLLTGGPLGLTALVLLFVHWAIATQRRFFQGKSFAVVWWAFGMVSFGAGALSWLLAMAVNSTLIDPTPVVFQWLLTVALYPFLTWVFARAQHAVLRQA